MTCCFHMLIIHSPYISFLVITIRWSITYGIMSLWWPSWLTLLMLRFDIIFTNFGYQTKLSKIHHRCYEVGVGWYPFTCWMHLVNSWINFCGRWRSSLYKLCSLLWRNCHIFAFGYFSIDLIVCLLCGGGVCGAAMGGMVFEEHTMCKEVS